MAAAPAQWRRRPPPPTPALLARDPELLGLVEQTASHMAEHGAEEGAQLERELCAPLLRAVLCVLGALGGGDRRRRRRRSSLSSSSPSAATVAVVLRARLVRRVMHSCRWRSLSAGVL
jgi:hypothetical protein